MPTTIKLKNSVTTTAAPTTLVQGEAAVNVTDKKVWVGNAASSPVQILGAGASLDGMPIGATTASTGAFTTLGATGVATFSAGTVSAPAITTTGDTNTGIYFPAANTIAFAEGGVEAMRINSAGDVGIGVTAPTAKLHVTNTGTVNSFLVEDSANPDATPFVIDLNGKTVIGHSAAVVTTESVSAQLQVHGTNDSGSQSINLWGSAVPQLQINRAGAGGIGTYTALASGNSIGKISFGAADGTAFVRAAEILAQVDGTTGTNDMPGRLVFSTTAGGASSPTERMRIDSTGAVGIGTTSLGSGYGMRISKTLTGVSSGVGLLNTVTANSTLTNLFGYNTSLNTATNSGTPYTIAGFNHYNAAQGTINADSTVTSQFGYQASSSLTGATNNFGFYGNIASGTGRWNFYAAGTAANYMAGTLQTGSTISVGNATPATSGAGITFPATQSASSNANTLDDYEEGTWNGTVSDGTNNATMSTNGGFYTKVGNLVTVTGYFACSSKGSLSGSLRVIGLPFTVVNGTGGYAGQAFGYTNGANITAGQNIGVYAEYNTTYLNLTYWSVSGGTVGLPATAINNNFDFILSLTYRVA